MLAMDKTNQNSFSELWKFILITVLVVLPIRLFVAKPFIVKGPSMDPTFATGQYLVIDQLSYHFTDPERGDVVVFKYPHDTKSYFIKRIIGLPGETVEIRYGKVSVKKTGQSASVVLDEPYILNTSGDSGTYELGEGEYFVMGDNRPASSDSRAWGNLEEKYIVGKPILRLFPPTDIDLLPGAEDLPDSI